MFDLELSSATLYFPHAINLKSFLSFSFHCIFTLVPGKRQRQLRLSRVQAIEALQLFNFFNHPKATTQNLSHFFPAAFAWPSKHNWELWNYFWPKTNFELLQTNCCTTHKRFQMFFDWKKTWFVKTSTSINIMVENRTVSLILMCVRLSKVKMNSPR